MSNSPSSPCWQQIEIAKQNSWFASRKAGREVVYDPPCLVDAPRPATSPPPGPSSPGKPEPARPLPRETASRTS